RFLFREYVVMSIQLFSQSFTCAFYRVFDHNLYNSVTHQDKSLCLHVYPLDVRLKTSTGLMILLFSGWVVYMASNVSRYITRNGSVAKSLRGFVSFCPYSTRLRVSSSTSILSR